MKMHAVDSTNLEAIGWQTDGTLTVLFKNGATYEFYGIQRGVYLALLKSESKGRFFSSAIRGRYDYSRLDTEE